MVLTEKERKELKLQLRPVVKRMLDEQPVATAIANAMRRNPDDGSRWMRERTGHLIEDEEGRMACSECGCAALYMSDATYCPDCGCKVQGDSE